MSSIRRRNKSLRYVGRHEDEAKRSNGNGYGETDKMTSWVKDSRPFQYSPTLKTLLVNGSVCHVDPSESAWSAMSRNGGRIGEREWDRENDRDQTR